MSEINEMITIEEMITLVGSGKKPNGQLNLRMVQPEGRLKVVGDILTNMENRLKKLELEKEDAESRESGFEKRIADLERSLEMKGRIIDTLCEQMGKMEGFQARTEPCINTLLREVGVLERKQVKAADDHFMMSSNIDTLFRANVDRNKEYQKLTEKYNREFAECNKDILGTHMTLMNYKRENEMMSNRIDDFNKENQSRDNSLDVIRLKLIDVLDEVEKNTGEAAEIKRMAFDIYARHKEYDRNFGASMSRMSELEKAMKSVTMHWSDIRLMKERINVLEQNLMPNS